MKNERPASFWRACFFGGIVGLNLLLFFRQPALQAGLLPYLAWSAVVLAVGAVLLISICRLRRLRMEGPRTGGRARPVRRSSSRKGTRWRQLRP